MKAEIIHDDCNRSIAADPDVKAEFYLLSHHPVKDRLMSIFMDIECPALKMCRIFYLVIIFAIILRKETSLHDK